MLKTNQEIFGQRLSEKRKSLGMTQKDLALAAGVSITSIQNYENGQIPRGEILVTLGSIMGCTAEWLVTGQGEMQRGAVGGSEQATAGQSGLEQGEHIYNDMIDCELVMVPLVKARLSAGSGSFETNGDSERHYAFRSEWIRSKGNAQAMVLMRVAGDSMEPEIKDKDVVLIDTSNMTPQPGRMFAVAVEDLVYLKKVDAEPGKLILSSANPAYAALEIDARGDRSTGIRIIGRAVWVGRDLD